MYRTRKITLTQTLVEGKVVKVGDSVGFKSDYEQYGRIVEITKDADYGWVRLTLENKNGFGGEYLRYSTKTTVPADECWI